MRLDTTKLVVVALCAMVAGIVIAAEPPTSTQQQMPEMGPPAEMKELSFLVGTWDVAAKFNASTDPAKENWMESKAVAVYSYIADGAGMQCVYSSESMAPGMPPMSGVMVQAYDRETKQWQATWLDNLSGRISLYTGNKDNGNMVMTGEDKMMGMTYLSRITIFNQTPTKYEWKMEASMDGGKTWMLSGTAVYTKKA